MTKEKRLIAKKKTELQGEQVEKVMKRARGMKLLIYVVIRPALYYSRVIGMFEVDYKWQVDRQLG